MEKLNIKSECLADVPRERSYRFKNKRQMNRALDFVEGFQHATGESMSAWDEAEDYLDLERA